VILPLIRRWAVDWLQSHESSVCAEIMVEDYQLHIGSVVLRNREEYVAGTMGQLANYPGLGLTIHEVIASGAFAAVRLTEHGAAVNRDGARAAWTVISLFESDGTRLIRTWAEEDYFARSRQLSAGLPDPIEPPAHAPWDCVEGAPDAGAEHAVRAWLNGPISPNDSIHINADDSTSVGPVDVGVLFSSGPVVAFHGYSSDDGHPLGVGGVVRVNGGRVVSGHLVTDRAGVASAKKRSSSPQR
jgi:hypothetical protein